MDFIIYYNTQKSIIWALAQNLTEKIKNLKRMKIRP